MTGPILGRPDFVSVSGFEDLKSLIIHGLDASFFLIDSAETWLFNMLRLRPLSAPLCRNSKTTTELCFKGVLCTPLKIPYPQVNCVIIHFPAFQQGINSIKGLEKPITLRTCSSETTRPGSTFPLGVNTLRPWERRSLWIGKKGGFYSKFFKHREPQSPGPVWCNENQGHVLYAKFLVLLLVAMVGKSIAFVECPLLC